MNTDGGNPKRQFLPLMNTDDTDRNRVIARDLMIGKSKNLTADERGSGPGERW
jgi:hypothetical protein